MMTKEKIEVKRKIDKKRGKRALRKSQFMEEKILRNKKPLGRKITKVTRFLTLFTKTQKIVKTKEQQRIKEGIRRTLKRKNTKSRKKQMVEDTKIPK